jgi:retinol dehydrogenase-14
MEYSIQGKSILVSGATNGIGLVAARELARMGAMVTILSRNQEKCARVAEDISRQTGGATDHIAADLSTLEGIRDAAAEYRKRNKVLHVLINNAGAFFARRFLTPDGFEKSFALNHLNYFLLTNLLLDMLKSSAPARIINVSSGIHTTARINFQDLQAEKWYLGMRAYGQSKLANLLFTYELARHLDGCGVTVNAVHPGYVNSGFTLNNGPLYRMFSGSIARLFGRSPEKGAQTILFLATSPEVQGMTGGYFFDGVRVESSRLSQDEAIASRLWQVSANLTGMDG